MAINIRIKGASAERDIADKLNAIVKKVLIECGQHDMLDNHNYFAQRNQQQTAVGGNDLINTYGFGIEVKRQEALSINTWWEQCTKAAMKNNEVPVLLFRQTRQKWRCITTLYIGLPKNAEGRVQFGQCRAEITIDDFLKTYEHHVRAKLKG